jgi:hypothetical protein
MASVRKASIYIFLILMACVDRVDLKLDGQNNQLVVDGLITDQPGPYTVRLSRSLKYDNSNPVTTYFLPEKGAKVAIVEQSGSVTVRLRLQEGESGVYQTNQNGFKGMTGRTYWVEIQTADGGVYQSEPETMLASAVMENLKPTLTIVGRLSTTTASLQETWGFRITVDTQDPADETNYYRWKTTGILEFLTYTDNGGFTCYLTQQPLETQVTLSDDKYVNGQKFTQQVAIAPYERITRYRAIVDQYSLTQRAFEYWDRIRAQQANIGSIFDAAPAQLIGNVTRTDKDGETVLGYFGASARTTIALTFNRLEAAGYRYPPNQIPPQKGFCTDIEALATTNTPEGF